VQFVQKKIIQAKKRGKKLLAILIDPEKFSPEVIHECNRHRPDFIFVGGSTVSKKEFKKTISFISVNSKLPIVLFPGDENQIDKSANAVLLLSLLSSRNPDFLIQKHIASAVKLKKSSLEIIPTGYILIDELGKSSTAKVTGSKGISPKKSGLISSTALAAEQLGFRLIYLESGSGAKKTIPNKVVKSTSTIVNLPLVVGGGINAASKAIRLWKNGADMVVVGNAIERNPGLIRVFCETRNRINQTKKQS
jgi:phosphoglycerol geranylgeranyltransferase